MIVLKIADVGAANAAEEAARVLDAGGVVLYPTDTLYGLAVDASNTEAVERLISLKGRDSQKAISVVVPTVGSIQEYVEVSPEAARLASAHLPGALTLVLPVRAAELRHLSDDGTLGVRVPDSAFTLALGQAFGRPYTATSANVAGLPSLATVPEVLEQFGEAAKHIDLAVDDGPREGMVPSTVVRVVDGAVEVLREGAIPQEALIL